MKDIELILSLCSAMAEILLDTSTKLREEKLKAARALDLQISRYENEYLPRLIKGIADRKLQFIVEAESSAELKRILSGKDSWPRYCLNDTWEEPRFHIPEEELLFWAHFTPGNRMPHYAMKRYIDLFQSVFGRDWLKGGPL